MKSIFFFFGLLAIFGCNNQDQNKSEEIVNEKLQLLKLNSKEPLTDKTLMFGFLIDMSRFEFKSRLDSLVEDGAIFYYQNSPYANVHIISTEEYEQEEYLLLTKLKFHLSKDSTLNGIYAYLYGPKSFIKPYKVYPPESNPIIEGNRMIEEITPEMINNAGRKIEEKIFNNTISNFTLKYGGVNKSYDTLFHTYTYTWFHKGKMIELELKNSNEVAKEYLHSSETVAEMEKLVHIGRVYYTSVEKAIRTDSLTKILLENLKVPNNEGYEKYQRIKAEEEERAKLRDKVNKSGI